MEFTKVGMQTFIALGTGAVLFFTVPLVIALIWCMKKKERFSTVLAGAATFLLFALVLEKPIQNVLLFPKAMGMEEHVASRFFAAHPVLLALAAGLFPGVFEETGRLVAFKTVLKNRKNRETSITYISKRNYTALITHFRHELFIFHIIAHQKIVTVHG